ncbi:MAG: Tfp pilus assembly protein PilF [Porticoccus sp.]|jgi:Tfp pilus assembly protein PilF
MMNISMVIVIKRWSTPFLVLCALSALLMVGCTTKITTDGVDVIHVDNQKMLDNRIQLALGYLSKGDHEGDRKNLNKAMEVDSRSP